MERGGGRKFKGNFKNVYRAMAFSFKRTRNRMISIHYSLYSQPVFFCAGDPLDIY